MQNIQLSEEDIKSRQKNFAFFIFTNTSSTNGEIICQDFLKNKADHDHPVHYHEEQADEEERQQIHEALFKEKQEQDKKKKLEEEEEEKQKQEQPQKKKRRDKKKKMEQFKQEEEEELERQQLEKEEEEQKKLFMQSLNKDSQKKYRRYIWKSDKVQFKIKDNTRKFDVTVYFVDLCDSKSKEKGFNTLKMVQESKKIDCRTVVAGGDGSIVWVIDEMIKFECHLYDQAITAIAVGTGNDFCRATGWGSNLEECIGAEKFTIPVLKKLTYSWINSTVQNLDIWDVEVQTFKEGCFQQIKGELGRRGRIVLQDHNHKKGEQPRQLETLKHHMVNYFSIGLDAQIGFDFDGHRTQNRHINKFFYCWMGFLKLFASKSRVDKIIDTFSSVVKKTKNSFCKRKNKSNNINSDDNSVLISTRRDQTLENLDNQDLQLSDRKMDFEIKEIGNDEDENSEKQDRKDSRDSQQKQGDNQQNPLQQQQQEEIVKQCIFRSEDFRQELKNKIAESSSQSHVEELLRSSDVSNSNGINNNSGYMLETDYEEQKGSHSKQLNPQQNNRQNKFLTGEPINLVCQNISSYCAGAVDIWQNCENGGLQNANGQRVRQNFSKQNQGDGKLEFITFRNIVEFIIERYVTGFGSRIVQGNGPYEVDFKRDLQNPIKTYFQIDGEYFEVIAPKKVIINQTKDIPEGKIKVMILEQPTD